MQTFNALTKPVRDPINKIKAARRFVRFLSQRFADDQCFEAAGTLAYTTMLALVPLGAVSLTIMAAFPQFQRVKEDLLGFLFTQFVPSAGSALQGYIEPLFDRASALTVTGIIALMVSAILMMNSIEAAFNRIWRVPTQRPPLQRFLVFWGTLTLGPLLLGISLVLSGYLRTSNFLYGAQIEREFLRYLPVLTAFVGFTLSYLIVPHYRVRRRHAVLGGLVATALFELAKRGFAWYVEAFPATRQIYDALSLLPIFMLWLYILWLIALLGASVTASLGAFRFERDAQPIPERHWLRYALLVLAALKRSQTEGNGLDEETLKQRVFGLTDDLLQRFLADFVALNLVVRSEAGRWVLGRDLHTTSLLELYRTGNYALPTESTTNELPIHAEQVAHSLTEACLQKLAVDTQKMLRQPLSDYLKP